MKKIISSAGILAIAIALGLTAFTQAKAQQGTGNQTANQEQNQEKNEEGNICKSKCGDNACDEVVCMAEGCPCAENNSNCPNDCPNKTTAGNQNQEQNQQQNLTSNQTGQDNSEGHRSVVANFVQSLLKVASSTVRSASTTIRGIGEQVRLIAQQQNESATNTIQAMEQVQIRNKVKTFFFGTDYKNLGALRNEFASTTNRLRELNKLMTGIQNASDTAEVQSQIQLMEQEQSRIENFVKEQEGKFSLFGWLVKLFNK